MVAAGTIIVMTDVPKGPGKDPFGHASWFDMAVRPSAAPLVREGGLDRTIVVRFARDGRRLIVDKFPETLCSGPCPADSDAPRARIVGTVLPPRVVHRYGPI